MSEYLAEILISQIVPNPEQPRTEFDQDALQGLADSILENGLIQPISVEATDDPEVFILEDGERRWRAASLASLASLKTIKAIVKPARENGTSSRDRLTAALVANLQREDMNPIDEAKAFQRMIEMAGYSVSEISRVLGVSYPLIKSRLALLALDEPIQELVASGKLQKDPRVVEALMAIPDPEARLKLARRMAAPGVTISLIEAASRKLLEKMQDSQGVPEDTAPATHYAQRQTGPVNVPIWERLANDGKLPPWELVKDGAKKACQQCAFFDSPSQSICGECPAVFLVSSLIKLSFSEGSNGH